MKKFLATAAAMSLAAVAGAAHTEYIGAGGAIPDGAGGNVPGPAFTSTINVPDSAPVADVYVTVDLAHTWVGDLQMSVSHGGNTAILVDRIGWAGAGAGDSSNYNGAYRFDSDEAGDIWLEAGNGTSAYDLAPGTYDTSDPISGAGNAALDVFDGMDSAGDWTLSIVDNFNFDTGDVNSWTLGVLPVPEPASLSLLALGGLALLRRR